MHRTRLLVTVTCATALLAGCPPTNQNTQATLTLQALAVTKADTTRSGLFDYDVYLGWNSVPRSTSYDVLAGTSTADLVSITPSRTSQTSYTDVQLQPGASQSYQIRALDVNAVELLRSNVASVTMLSHDATMSAPTNLQITGAGTGLAGSDAPSAQPTITWTAAPDATAYYVVLTQQGSAAPVFAALASTPSVTIGTVYPKVNWPNYSQVGNNFSLASGTTYTITVSPLRTDTGSLASASAIDLGPSASDPILYTK